jgi:uncharacterized protein (TIGR02391 family)
LILLKLAQEARGGNVHISQFEMPLWNSNSSGYPHHKRTVVGRAVAEAWQWLQNEGLLIVAPDQPNGFFCLTRKGDKLKNPADVEAYRHGNVLPVALLHPTLAEKVRPMFLRGEYDTAVLQAFIEVEVAVRSAAKFSNSDIGRKLMQAAFNPDNGPLTDTTSDKGERVGLMDLFSGAIGHCKNPSSHRNVGLQRLAAAQLITFASHLLMQVDAIETLKAGKP